MNTVSHGLVPLLGRILLSAIFLLSAFGRITDFAGTTNHMTSEGIVLAPLFLIPAIAVELFGGLSLLFGFLTRLGSLALMVFLIPVTAIFHDFWQYTGMEQTMQMIHFLKNLAIMGGLLLIVAYGPGTWSIDRRRSPRVPAT